MLRSALLALLLPYPAMACQTALLLAMDVSNSVDPAEYRLQVDGLAAALRDGEIAEILVRDRVAVAVMQWSGVDRQQLTIPWIRMAAPSQPAALANRVETMERAYVLSDTAPAEALLAAIAQFETVQDCARKVIDVSGDGTPNAGSDVGRARTRAQLAGITVNGLAIEHIGIAITNFYRRQLITRDGFVETAQGHRDYARAIRVKMLREISRIMGDSGFDVDGRRHAAVSNPKGSANTP
ncbi:DUF1194 domain-containing protein [Thalassococcus sp. CAU 1522]|uniref:DUF1194 domain-containing protein n=1 Tax=Thalassococcus arenae TaxID=2851652 RepID=A0ABS6NBJ2_9RHOB|nr:DUF1194 domain-containing protein [Thalassococcus arenae]MBV2360915.1 DUF1194 domain-containing protein [Thalassococcus arenae]